ncbi:MAG: PadR family transcriptional regulator [Chloroflexota bacterium]
MEEKPHHIGTLSPEMALLGQLYSAPSHGYDLHRKVVSELGQVWHLSQSQAYSILKRLEKQGDILVQEISQEKLPSRQLMHMTDQGRQRFLTWLEAPSGGSTRAIRMEFITRLYFLQMTMPEKLIQAFERQKLEAKVQIDRLTHSRAELSNEQVFNRMSVDLRLKQLDAVLDWLAEYEDIFKRAE